MVSGYTGRKEFAFDMLSFHHFSPVQACSLTSCGLCRAATDSNIFNYIRPRLFGGVSEPVAMRTGGQIECLTESEEDGYVNSYSHFSIHLEMLQVCRQVPLLSQQARRCSGLSVPTNRFPCLPMVQEVPSFNNLSSQIAYIELSQFINFVQ